MYILAYFHVFLSNEYISNPEKKFMLCPENFIYTWNGNRKYKDYVYRKMLVQDYLKK